MLNELRGRIDDLSEDFNRETVSVKKDTETIKNWSDMKNTKTKMKDILEGINSRLGEAEDWISELEDKVAVNTQLEQQKEKRI